MMENFISVFVALAFLQFMRGYFASKGYSHLKMSLIGASLSTFTLLLFLAGIWVNEGGEVVESRIRDPIGILIGFGFVTVYSLTYCISSKSKTSLNY
ncbi:hypothetical protein [Teredinibacter turnerae]|uniref:hypothetical protein n=1 Tax=Teredinibacter turnerae TaxID=2426 RepID=UPI000365F389|nr:hypothetical protein [Teredinibacter turnerae]